MNASSDYSSLFERRTPEAAARQLSIVLASATEWNLATLERLQERKASTAYDKSRQQDICTKLVFHCRDLGVQPYGLNGWLCKRLSDELAKTNQEAQA